MRSKLKTSSFPRKRESSALSCARQNLNWLHTVAALICFFAIGAARAEVETVHPPIALTDQQEALYKSLLPELRCLVCQNESLAESQASLAADLRYEVRGLVAKGENEQQIKQYLTDRYGDFVLYKPPFESRTVLLWAGPAMLTISGLLMLLAFARHTRLAPAAPPKADADAVKKILDEDKDA